MITNSDKCKVYTYTVFRSVFSQFQCSQRLSVHQHSVSFVLNVVLMWSRISSNNVLLSDLQPCCLMASIPFLTACLASIRFKSVSHSSLLVVTTVRRRLRRTFLTHFEIFRRRFDGVVIYFFNSDFKFFDDASEFSVISSYVVFIFS